MVGAGVVGAGEEADLFLQGEGLLDVGEVCGEDVGVGCEDGEAVAGAGDAGELGEVSVGVALFEIELRGDFDEEGALDDGGVGIEEAVGFGALEGNFEIAGRKAAEGAAVVAGGIGGFGEGGGGEDGGGRRGGGGGCEAGGGADGEAGVGGEIFLEDFGGDGDGFALGVAGAGGAEADEFSTGGEFGADGPADDLSPEAVVDIMSLDLAEAPRLIRGEVKGFAEADVKGGEEGVAACGGEGAGRWCRGGEVVVGAAGGVELGEGPDDGGRGFGLGERAVPIPGGGGGPEGGVGGGIEAELAEEGDVAFGGEVDAEAFFGMAGDLVGGELRGFGDGEEIGEGRAGVGGGHLAFAGDGDEGGAFVADGGGDELLLLGGEGGGRYVADDEEIEGLPFFKRLREELGFGAGIVGGGFDGRRGSDAGDFCGVEEDGLGFEAGVALEKGGEVAEFPAGAVIDEEGEEFVSAGGDAEGLAIVGEVGFAEGGDGADLVFEGSGGSGGGGRDGGLVDEGDRFDGLSGGDGEGFGADDDAGAEEFDADFLILQAVEADEGACGEGVIAVDPIGGIDLFDGGIGGDEGGADEDAVDADAAGGEEAGGFGGIAGEVVSAIGEEDDGGGFIGGELFGDELECGGDAGGAGICEPPHCLAGGGGDVGGGGRGWRNAEGGGLRAGVEGLLEDVAEGGDVDGAGGLGGIGEAGEAGAVFFREAAEEGLGAVFGSGEGKEGEFRAGDFGDAGEAGGEGGIGGMRAEEGGIGGEGEGGDFTRGEGEIGLNGGPIDGVGGFVEGVFFAGGDDAGAEEGGGAVDFFDEGGGVFLECGIGLDELDDGVGLIGPGGEGVKKGVDLAGLKGGVGSIGDGRELGGEIGERIFEGGDVGGEEVRATGGFAEGGGEMAEGVGPVEFFTWGGLGIEGMHGEGVIGEDPEGASVFAGGGVLQGGLKKE